MGKRVDTSVAAKETRIGGGREGGGRRRGEEGNERSEKSEGGKRGKRMRGGFRGNYSLVAIPLRVCGILGHRGISCVQPIVDFAIE